MSGRITTGDQMHVYGCFACGIDYTVRVKVVLDDKIDPDLLKCAVKNAGERFPYLGGRLQKDSTHYYYEDNPEPISVINTCDRIELGTAMTGYHVWAVCYFENTVYLDCFHGATDGNGLYRLLATILYYYCDRRYGGISDKGIMLLGDEPDTKEISDPLDSLPEIDLSTIPQPVYEQAFTLETDGGLTPSDPTIWDVEIPEDEFVKFTSHNDSSPGTMISLLFARAIDGLYPERDKEIISSYVVNARPMLGAKETIHNCLSMVIMKYEEKIRKLPFVTQCTVYRGKTFIQSDPDAIRSALTVNANYIRAVDRMETLEEKEKIYGQMFAAGEGYITYLVSYIGRWPHKDIGEHIKGLYPHPPNTFSLMSIVSAAGGKIYMSVQQRFKEDSVREAFLKQLEMNGISYNIVSKIDTDIARFEGV